MRELHLFIFLIASIAGVSCKAKKESRSLPPIKVEVAEAQSQKISDKLEVATKIEGLNNAVIQPRVDGFLTAIAYDDGMPVKRGQLLFQIDPASLSTSLYSARASLESARASEILAERNYQRALPLSQIDAISQSDLDQYRATYKAAKASTKSAEEALRSAELNIGYTDIYSPIDGIAEACSATVGDYVGPSTLQNKLTTISYLDTVVVNIAIPTATYLKHISASQGQSYDNSSLLSNISLILSDSTLYDHKGEYYYTKKDTPSTTSSVIIVAKFPNPELKLKQGMFSRIRCDIGSTKECIVVPQSAVSQMQGINSVWLVEKDSIATYRQVKLAGRDNGLWVIEQGVNAGDEVITAGGLKMHNGAKVAPIKTK